MRSESDFGVPDQHGDAVDGVDEVMTRREVGVLARWIGQVTQRVRARHGRATELVPACVDEGLDRR